MNSYGAAANAIANFPAGDNHAGRGTQKMANNLQGKTSGKLAALTATLQNLVAESEKIETTESDLKLKLKQSHALAAEIASELNVLVESLRPTFMDTLGIVPAIRHYVETNVIPAGIGVSFHLEYDGSDLPMDIATRLFRVVQGAIGNIVQHSKAKNASISMQRYDDELVLRISDDGKGFDVAQFTRIQENGRGAGLFGIKERIRLLGGRCAVQSNPGQGTHVTITIPLSKDMEAIAAQNIIA
jgi:signal transduction histidine kinase